MTDAQSGTELPQWVSQLRSHRQRAAIGIALNVADAVLALRDPDVPAAVRQRLRSIVDRAEQLGAAVPVTMAARLLGVTERAARVWVDRGVLTSVPGTRPPAVSARSLGEALAAAIVIRDVGRDEVVLRSVLHVLDDQRARQELAGRIEELDARLPLDDDHLEGLLSET